MDLLSMSINFNNKYDNTHSNIDIPKDISDIVPRKMVSINNNYTEKNRS